MHTIKKLESIFIDAVAAITPWLAPLIPAFLVYHNMTERLGYTNLFGLIGAASVEFLGLSAVHTAVTFHQWNDNHKSDRAPFWFAFGAGAFYVVIILTVNAALDIWQDQQWVKILAHALLSLLSVDAAAVIAMRAQHASRLNARIEAREERRKGKRDSHENKNSREIPTNETKLDFEKYVSLNQSRNGQGAISPQELINAHQIPRATAYRWHKLYIKTHPEKVKA